MTRFRFSRLLTLFAFGTVVSMTSAVRADYCSTPTHECGEMECGTARQTCCENAYYDYVLQCCAAQSNCSSGPYPACVAPCAKVPSADDGSGLYIGCFEDAPDRALPFLAAQGYMTPSLCRKACAANGFEFAGVQAGSECWCGDEVGYELRSGECTSRCTGNDAVACGGAWRNSVYFTN